VPTLALALALAGGVLATFFALFLFAKRFLYVVQPNEVLVFSGGKNQTADGRSIGYRTVFSGRAWRTPIVEQVERMDLSLITVPIGIRGAYSEGGIPLQLNAIANVKISSNPQIIGNAIERFLHQKRDQIARVAKETLEGHLRGVVATMTPEEVNEDRLAFAERLTEEASADLRKLGLQLDVLKIQAVHDDRQYLDSIGRARIAEIVRDAEVAESDAIRASEEAEARSHARGGVAKERAEAQVARKNNELRQIRADLWAGVRSAQARAEQAAHQARAEAEKELQQVRAAVERLRLQADVTIPAEAAREARTIEAEGEAAVIAANGHALSQALELVAEAWRECGDRAMDMVVLQNLESIVGQVSETAASVAPKRVQLLDGGDGSTVASYVSAYPRTVGALLDQLRETLGVDVRAVLREKQAETRDTTPPHDTREAA